MECGLALSVDDPTADLGVHDGGLRGIRGAGGLCGRLRGGELRSADDEKRECN